MLKGTIVENSLVDKSILSEIKIEKTWQSGNWILHNVLVEEETAKQIGNYLADGPWYIHFWEPGKDDVLVVYKGKNFSIKHSDKSTWSEAVAYGQSIGIPSEQLDFVIDDNSHEVVVTSYTEPDLDGYACSVAYAEFLNKTGTPAVVRIFGTPHIEVQHLVEKFGFHFEEDNNASLEKVVLTDASELRDLDKFIKPENIVEIIDHRKFNDADAFKNAKIQIELVGSAATLIAEKFHANNVEISVPTATMLYGAIVSNTLNFRAKVTTDRDRLMADWLNQKLGLTKEFIDDMFRAKSNMDGDRLAQAVDADFAWFDFGGIGNKIGYAQLEMMDAKQLVETHKNELFEILNDLKSKEGVDHIFISFIDLGGGFNVFVSDDEHMKNVLSKVLNISFEDNVAIRSDFIMRKEVTPLLKAYFAKK